MPDDELRDWTFKVDEISNGHYRGEGSDLAGRSVAASGDDPDVLLEKLRRWALEMMRR